MTREDVTVVIPDRLVIIVRGHEADLVVDLVVDVVVDHDHVHHVDVLHHHHRHHHRHHHHHHHLIVIHVAVGHHHDRGRDLHLLQDLLK